MFNDIYNLIKEFSNIVIARHVGPDPDAMASTMALKDSIILTFKDKKVLVFKYKSKKDYHRLIGHRQQYTKVRVESITLA